MFHVEPQKDNPTFCTSVFHVKQYFDVLASCAALFHVKQYAVIVFAGEMPYNKNWQEK